MFVYFCFYCILSIQTRNSRKREFVSVFARIELFDYYYHRYQIDDIMN